jgi:hypothetical protein
MNSVDNTNNKNNKNNKNIQNLQGVKDSQTMDVQSNTQSLIKRKPNLLSTFKAVAWSFIGVRKGSSHADDMTNLNPVYVIFAGILSAAIFVGILIAVVNQVVAK